jgi:hypothetical protein
VALNRYWIYCVAVVLSACSGAGREDAAMAPAAEVARGSTATPTLDGVRNWVSHTSVRDRGRRARTPLPGRF